VYSVILNEVQFVSFRAVVSNTFTADVFMHVFGKNYERGVYQAHHKMTAFRFRSAMYPVLLYRLHNKT
jgi:hypothetical protein